MRRIGHQHTIAAGQAQIGGESCAFIASLFLNDLHQNNLAALDNILNFVTLAQGPCAFGAPDRWLWLRFCRHDRHVRGCGLYRVLLRPLVSVSLSLSADASLSSSASSSASPSSLITAIFVAIFVVVTVMAIDIFGWHFGLR